MVRSQKANAGKKKCPECDHVFQGNGWDGIDAHWRAKHASIMTYEEAWPLIKSGSYVSMPPQITSTDYWFKVVEMLQQNWALIECDQESKACTVYFIHDRSGIFDQISFPSVQDTYRALLRNGFARFADNLEAQEFISPPQPPFFRTQHPNGAIYSSGRYWTS